MTHWPLRVAWLLAAGVALGAAVDSQALGAAPTTAPTPAQTPARDASAVREVAARPGADPLELERLLRARPAQAAGALQAAAGRTQAGSDLQVELLLAAAKLYSATHDRDAVDAIIAALQAQGSPVALAAALAARAEWQLRHDSLGRAARLLGDALTTLPETAAPSLRVRLLRRHGRALEGLGRLEESVRVQQQALRLARTQARVPAWQESELCAALAYTFHLAEQPERAWALNAEAIRLARHAADELALSGAMTTQGILLSTLGRSAEELQAMEAALHHAQRAGAMREHVLGLANLADFYLKREDYGTALELARRALPLAREARDPVIESVALTNAGLALIALGQREEGLGLVRESLLLEERAGAITTMAQIQLELGLTLERAGHLRQAWAALMDHRRLAAEVFQREHQQAMLELQEGFDHDTRQRELAMLKAENGLKEAQLEGRQLQQRLSAGAVAAGGLLLAVVVVLVRRMRHSNQALLASSALLKVASERDALTGLANRRHFQAVMQQDSAQQAARATHPPDEDAAAGGVPRRAPPPAPALQGSLLLIDVDHFKRINDTYGHALGDAVLVELSRRLVATLREQDLTVRWGGEEFLVYARGLPPEQVDVLAERLLAAIGSTPVRHGRERIAVTASIGFATFPLLPERQAIDWERAVDLVDKAMYLAKAHGRNRAYGVRALTAEHHRSSLDPEALESAWRNGRAELSRVQGPRPAAAAASTPGATPAAPPTADVARSSTAP